MADAVVFDHIAIAVGRLDDAADLIVGELGGRPHEGGPGPGHRWAQWVYPPSGRIEILEPDGPPGGFLHRFLDRSGPGIHHVTFKVPSIREAADAAGRMGYDVVGYRDENPGWKEAFLHPKGALGIVVQMAEVGAGEDEENWGGDFPFPASPAPRGEPAEIVGLRMTARSEERARRQWEGLLGATVTGDDGLLLFRWSGSSMRIAVAIDRDRSEGPVGIEFASDRPHLEEGTHLGVRFLRQNP